MIARREINQGKDGSQAGRGFRKLLEYKRFVLYLHVCPEQGIRIPLSVTFVTLCSLQISAGCPLSHPPQVLPVVLLNCQQHKTKVLSRHKQLYLRINAYLGDGSYKRKRAPFLPPSFFLYPLGPPSQDWQTCDLHPRCWTNGTGQSDASCQDTLSTVASVLFMRLAVFSSMADHFSMQDELASGCWCWTYWGEDTGWAKFSDLMPSTKEMAGCV